MIHDREGLSRSIFWSEGCVDNLLALLVLSKGERSLRPRLVSDGQCASHFCAPEAHQVTTWERKRRKFTLVLGTPMEHGKLSPSMLSVK